MLCSSNHRYKFTTVLPYTNVLEWPLFPDSTRIRDSLGRVNATSVACVMSKCCFIIPEDNCNFMEKRHNADPLDSLCLPVVVPTVVNILIWAEQMPSSHRLHVFSAACMPTRPRPKSQQCNSGYYKPGTDHFAALSRLTLRLPLQPIRYSSAIYLFRV